MLLKEYKSKRINAYKYYNLLKTLQDLYNGDLDEMLVYPQDVFNREYENGRLLLIFSDKFLIKVNFNEDSVSVIPKKYDEIKFYFSREEGKNFQPGALHLFFGDEEIILSPITDFTPQVANNYLGLPITIFRFLLSR